MYGVKNHRFFDANLLFSDEELRKVMLHGGTGWLRFIVMTRGMATAWQSGGESRCRAWHWCQRRPGAFGAFVGTMQRTVGLKYLRIIAFAAPYFSLLNPEKEVWLSLRVLMCQVSFRFIYQTAQLLCECRSSS